MSGNSKEQPKSILDHPEIKDFIKDREIAPEDFGIIERLSEFDNNLVIECLHNHFNLLHERSEGELERYVKAEYTRDDARKLYAVMLEFARKYDWAVCWSLVRILEEI